MHEWTLVILLLSATSRGGTASTCYSRNCTQVVSNQNEAETFQCKLGYEKEFEDFKRHYGVRDLYVYPAADVLHEKPTLTTIKLYDYTKTYHPGIIKDNTEDLENITHGLAVDIAIPGDRDYKALYVRFSSSGEFGNTKDNFYHRFPKKYLYEFAVSKRVTITNLLCLEGIQPYPVSYTLLLTLYPKSMPQSSIYHVSFSKENLAVAISLYPTENSIHVYFDTYSDYCECRVRLCTKTIERDCEIITKPIVTYYSSSHTFTDVASGIYYAKIEQHCPGDVDSEESTISIFMQSALIEIPVSFRQSSLKKEDDDDRNTPFVVIGCLLALLLLIVMYIAIRKKVSHLISSFFKRNRHTSRNADMIASDQHTNTQMPTIPLYTIHSQRTSQPSIYSSVSENSLDQEQISMIDEEQLKRGLTVINEIHSDYDINELHSDDDDLCCPVHGPDQTLNRCVNIHY